MKLQISWLLALAGLLAAASCVEDEGLARFSTAGSCDPGDISKCDCPGEDVVGERVCQENGLYAEYCACPGCSRAPDCGGCDGECFDECMCRTSGLDERACERQCDGSDADAGAGGDGGASGTGGGSSGGTPSVPPPPATNACGSDADCPGGCCAPDTQTCGTDVIPVGCLASEPNGVKSNECPDADTQSLGAPMSLPLIGCCLRSLGRCGFIYDLGFAGNGECIDGVGMTGTPTPCGQIQ